MSVGEAPEPDQVDGARHPRQTASLVGQDAAQAAFLHAVDSGRMHHAWLLTGPRGVGKATLAWRMARHLSAGTPGGSLEMDPEDPVFRQVAGLVAPGVMLCRRPWDPKTERYRTAITVDEVRALKAFFRLSATGRTWRIAIVDSTDDLTTSAANALLKILEEPPERAVLILISHRPALLLPTLRSRCRELRCRRLEAREVAQVLRSTETRISDGESAALAALADGSAGRAFELRAQDGAGLYDRIIGLLSGAPGLSRAAALDLADAAAGRAGVSRIELTLDLIELALFRLARCGADPASAPPALGSEQEVRERLGASPAQARIWSEALPRLRARAEAARAVNLDPAQIILDTILQVDRVASDAARSAS